MNLNPTYRCPNCGDWGVPLYENEYVIHCGCFYEKAQHEVRLHVSDPLPVEGFDEPWGID